MRSRSYQARACTVIIDIRPLAAIGGENTMSNKKTGSLSIKRDPSYARIKSLKLQTPCDAAANQPA